MPRLRFVGQQSTSFRDVQLASGAMARVGSLEPGQEFGVPEEVVEQFLRRDDIVEVAEDAPPTEDAKPAKSRAKASADAPVPDAPPEPSEAAETPSPAAE